METALDPKHPQFRLPTLPGKPLRADVERYLKAKLSTMLNCNASRFPGAQPISFTRQHVETLKQTDFFVAEKSDGIRCLLLSTVEEGEQRTVLIDRKNEYRWVPEVALPLPCAPPTFDQFHDGTVVDGELVCDVERDGRVVSRYLAFDLLSFQGENYTKKPLTKRLGVLKQNVVKPHKQLLDTNREYAAQAVFSIEMKEQQVAYGISRVLNVDIPNLKHGNDGLIFTEIFASYVVGSTSTMLKWKPPSENSVDFRVRVVRDASGQASNKASTGVKEAGLRKRLREGSASDNDGDSGAEWRKEKKSKPDSSKSDAEVVPGREEGTRSDDYDQYFDREVEEFDFGFDSAASEPESSEPKSRSNNGNEAPTGEKRAAEKPSGDGAAKKGDSVDDDPVSGSGAPSRPSEASKLELYVQGKGKSEIFWGEMVASEEEWQRMNAEGRLDGRIVECTYSPERGGWVFMRFREDKPDPNYISIAEKIMQSIRDGVESEELVRAEPDIRSNWKRRDPTRPEQLPAKRR